MDYEMKACVRHFSLLGFLSWWIVSSASAGEISGKVTLQGTPPAEIQIPLTPECGHTGAKLQTRFYVVGSDGGLANVFVYIKDPPRDRKYEPPAHEALLDQVNCDYQPYVMAVMTHQKVRIRNSDPLLHNVNSSTSPNTENRFNVPQASKGVEMVRTFPKPELPVKIMCNVHNWMFSYIGVFDHPYFAVTGKDGTFKLPADLPPGKYTLVFKHMKAGEVSQPVTLGPGENKTINFAMMSPTGR